MRFSMTARLACQKAGVVLSTIFPSRFHESSQLLKGAIDKGRFGKLTMGDAYVKWFRTQEYYDSGAWRDLHHHHRGEVRAGALKKRRAGVKCVLQRDVVHRCSLRWCRQVRRA